MIALAEVVPEIRKGIKSGYALTFLLDIEGAFNHTYVESICQGAREHGFPKQCEGGCGACWSVEGYWRNGNSTDGKSGLVRVVHRGGPVQHNVVPGG